MEKIFVTGSSGFIGSLLVPELVKLNHEVHILQRPVTGRYGGSQDVHTFTVDIRDHVAIQDIIEQLQPDIVIHLAALSPVSLSYDHPFEYLETNFTASVNLAEANRKLNPNLIHFLAAGTSEEYGIQEVTPIKETADLRPNSPYAVSKVAMDRYLQYLRDAYQFPMTLLRPFNTYGRINSRHFVMERMLTQMLNGDEEVRLGDPDPIRDFMYASDHVQAYLTCLNNEAAKQKTFNFCTGIGVSIDRLSEIMRELTDYQGDIIWHTIPRRPLDIPVLIGDNSKALNQLGWRSLVSLEEGLVKTMNNLSERQTPYVVRTTN